MTKPDKTLDRIRDRLTAALKPESIEVVDESGMHVGHAGAIPGKVTHVRVLVTAEAFQGKSRLDRHRMVNDLLNHEMSAGLHALAIVPKAPGE
jgi:BolA protein